MAVHVAGGLGGDEVNYLRRSGPGGQLLLEVRDDHLLGRDLRLQGVDESFRIH